MRFPIAVLLAWISMISKAFLPVQSFAEPPARAHWGAVVDFHFVCEIAPVPPTIKCTKKIAGMNVQCRCDSEAIEFPRIQVALHECRNNLLMPSDYVGELTLTDARSDDSGFQGQPFRGSFILEIVVSHVVLLLHHEKGSATSWVIIQGAPTPLFFANIRWIIYILSYILKAL